MLKLATGFCLKCITTALYLCVIMLSEVVSVVTEAQKRATTKYEHFNYDKITVRIPKGQRERYKTAAELAGKSLNQYIIDLIENDINSR